MLSIFGHLFPLRTPHPELPAVAVLFRRVSGRVRFFLAPQMLAAPTLLHSQKCTKWSNGLANNTALSVSQSVRQSGSIQSIVHGREEGGRSAKSISSSSAQYGVRPVPLFLCLHPCIHSLLLTSLLTLVLFAVGRPTD